MFVILNKANNSVLTRPFWDIEDLPEHLLRVDISGCVITNQAEAERLTKFLAEHYKTDNIQLMKLVPVVLPNS